MYCMYLLNIEALKVLKVVQFISVSSCNLQTSSSNHQFNNEKLNEKVSSHWTKCFIKTCVTFGREARNMPREFSEWNLENLQQQWGRCVYTQEFPEIFLIHTEHVQQSRWKLNLLLTAVPRLFIYTKPPELWPNSHRNIEDFPLLRLESNILLRCLEKHLGEKQGIFFLMFEAIQDSRYCSFHCTAWLSNSFTFSGLNLWFTFVFLFSFIDCTNFISHHSSVLPCAALKTKFNHNVSKLGPCCTKLG